MDTDGVETDVGFAVHGRHFAEDAVDGVEEEEGETFGGRGDGEFHDALVISVDEGFELLVLAVPQRVGMVEAVDEFADGFEAAESITMPPLSSLSEVMKTSTMYEWPWMFSRQRSEVHLRTMCAPSNLNSFLIIMVVVLLSVCRMRGVFRCL